MKTDPIDKLRLAVTVAYVLCDYRDKSLKSDKVCGEITDRIVAEFFGVQA
jgi:hypothetical protein